MRTYTIHNARVLRVDRTRLDPNGNRGARLYAQEGVAGPLFILTVSGQLCPYDVEQMAGRIYRALSVRLNGVATHNGRLDAPPSELDDYHRFPVLEGTDDSGDARAAGGLLVAEAMGEVVQLIDREAMGAGNMSSRDRALLQAIIDGVADLERHDRATELQHLTVALADEEGQGLGVYGVAQALEILNDNLHMDRGGVDVSDRAQAEVWPSIAGPRNGGSAFAWAEDEGGG